MSNPYKQNVKWGAALLDDHFGKPNWRKKCEGMKINSLEDCNLGRLFGSFKRGCDVLGIRTSDAWRYGFDIRDDGNYKLLQEAWEDEFANPPLGTDDE